MKFIADIEKKEWFYEPDEKFDFPIIQMYFGFRDNEKLPVEFDNLSFGYKLTKNDVTISEDSMPPEGIRYISTDQETVHSFEVGGIRGEEEYYITVWAENGGEKWEYIVLFIMPIPPKPHESWSWNDEESMWQPPIPYPDDEYIYIWNEDSRSWQKI